VLLRQEQARAKIRVLLQRKRARAKKVCPTRKRAASLGGCRGETPRPPLRPGAEYGRLQRGAQGACR
jgi:hypothetical protein